MVSSKKLYTLKATTDFDKLKKSGRRVQPNSWIILSYLEKSTGIFRCGWTIPTYVGSAVIRNRFKRWCREFFREKNFEYSMDINVVFRRKEEGFYKKLRHEELDKALEKAMDKLRRSRNET